MKSCIWMTGLLAGATLAGVVQASPLPLEGRDIRGIPVSATDASAVFEYDPNLNITWLRDWNSPGTSMVDWDAAVRWASALRVGGFGGWVLPAIDPGDTSCGDSFDPGGGFPIQHDGLNCTGSAMGYLYYVEGFTPDSNPGPFLNVQSYYYWSGTEYAPDPGNAWYFGTRTGSVDVDDKGHSPQFAVAVRLGDVAGSVPEPGSLLLVLLALGAGVASRRRPR